MTEEPDGLLPEVEPGTRPYHMLKWLAVDFDNTLAETLWTPENPTRRAGDPIWPNIDKLFKAIDAGFKIVIHTARSWTDYEYIEWWLNRWHIPYHHIVCGKILATAYIDDKAINADAPSWIPPGRE